MKSAIWGVGTTCFAKQPLRSASDLVREAVFEAFADAAVDSVEAVFGATVFGGPGTLQRALQTAGVVEVPMVTIENASASGTTAVHEAIQAVESGRYERVLAVGVETMTSHFHTSILPEQDDREGRQGLAMPGIYAMAASRYMAEFSLSLTELASVSVKNHGNGALNPRAQHQRPVTADEVLSSRMIADPLTLLQCCSISDAAAAAIVGPYRGSRDVLVRGSVLRSGGFWDHRSNNVWGWKLVHDTALEAFNKAGIGPHDIDVYEVHDAFTISEIVTIEALGLTEPGLGGRLTQAGHTGIGGRWPVNPSGGLLARGHPLGATGLAQIAEVTWQLRGEGGPRQVPEVRTAAVETMGGGTAGIDGNGCVVVVLEGPNSL